MDILINNKKIDYILENERFLREVIHSIQQWLTASRYVITSVRADSLDVTDVAENDADKTTLDGIQLLDIRAQLPEELIRSNLETVVDYLHLLKEAVSTKAMEKWDELKDGYPYMLSSLQFTGLATDTDEDFLLLQNPEHHIESTESVDDVLQAVGRIESKAASMLRELEDPKDLVQDIIDRLSRSSVEVAEVSLMLQTGEDQEAMNRIIRFSDLCDSVLRFLSLVSHSRRIPLEEQRIGEKTVEEFFTDLNDNLRELLDAFQNHDSVLIGDLLEYEIAPRLDQLMAFFKTVRTLIS